MWMFYTYINYHAQYVSMSLLVKQYLIKGVYEILQFCEHRIYKNKY